MNNNLSQIRTLGEQVVALMLKWSVLECSDAQFVSKFPPNAQWVGRQLDREMLVLVGKMTKQLFWVVGGSETYIVLC